MAAIDSAAPRRHRVRRPGARARLEAITHPASAPSDEARLDALAAAGHRLAIYEATLLVEAGRHRETSTASSS